MRRRTLLSLAAVAAVAVIVVPSCLPLRDSVKDGPGVTGVYAVNGVDTIGNEYSGTVDVRRGDGADLAVQWLITGVIQEGQGTVEGSRLDLTWRTVAGSQAGTTGTATYTIAADGSLSGTRSIDGVEGVATERWFLQP